jgi:hypothetical protein
MINKKEKMALDFNSLFATQADPQSMYQQVASYLGISMGVLFIILAIISIWSLVWKGFALWKSAAKRQKIWFIVLLVVNTVGILEILYIYIFSKIGEKKKSSAPEEAAKKKKK